MATNTEILKLILELDTTGDAKVLENGIRAVSAAFEVHI